MIPECTIANPVARGDRVGSATLLLFTREVLASAVLTSTFGGVIGFLPGGTKASRIMSDLVAAYGNMHNKFRYALYAVLMQREMRLSRVTSLTDFLLHPIKLSLFIFIIAAFKRNFYSYILNLQIKII